MNSISLVPIASRATAKCKAERRRRSSSRSANAIARLPEFYLSRVDDDASRKIEADFKARDRWSVPDRGACAYSRNAKVRLKDSAVEVVGKGLASLQCPAGTGAAERNIVGEGSPPVREPRRILTTKVDEAWGASP